MPEWRAGLLAARLGEVMAAGVMDAEVGLGLVASAIEAKAKDALGQTSHRHGTPSPAPKGGPPSLVSGTGRRSIGQEHARGPDGLVIKVGTQAGVYPPRYGHARTSTPSSKYLSYQETLPRFDHPFLKPSFDAVVREEAIRRLLSAFTWPKW